MAHRHRKKQLWILVSGFGADPQPVPRICSARLNYAVRQGWLAANPLTEVDRASTRRRASASCGATTSMTPARLTASGARPRGLRGSVLALRRTRRPATPRRGPGLRWGAVDFNARRHPALRQLGPGPARTTKTSEFEAIPMTPRLARALMKLKQRGFATGDDDFVFADEPHPTGRCGKALREAFKLAPSEAGLKPITMYNLRHSFGTSLAATASTPGRSRRSCATIALPPPNSTWPTRHSRAREPDHPGARPSQPARERLADPSDSPEVRTDAPGALGGRDPGQVAARGPAGIRRDGR